MNLKQQDILVLLKMISKGAMSYGVITKEQISLIFFPA